MLQKLFHVNICVRDMERSIRFYQDLGFNKVNDFTLGVVCFKDPDGTILELISGM